MSRGTTSTSYSSRRAFATFADGDDDAVPSESAPLQPERRSSIPPATRVDSPATPNRGPKNIHIDLDKINFDTLDLKSFEEMHKRNRDQVFSDNGVDVLLDEDEQAQEEVKRRADADKALLARHLKQARVQRESEEVVLEDMATCVERLQAMGRDIGVELHTQSELLNEFAQEVEETHEDMNGTLRKLDRVIEKSGRSHCRIIVILTVVTVFLFFLVIYT